MNHYHVAVALIGRDDRWLVQQRPDGGHLAGCWEFPGGKVEAGETARVALVRELAEEVGIAVVIHRPLPAIDHDYGDRRVTLHPFLCSATGEAVAGEGQRLRWATAEELVRLPIPEANRGLVAALIDGER